MVRLVFVWIDVKFSRNLCSISVIISHAKVVRCERTYHIQDVNFTHCHHFCSIISDMSPNPKRARITCSNCGVLGVAIDPCEYCTMLPQCRKCRRRMPARCFAKSSTANICEVRHVLSVSIDSTFLTLHSNKQTRFSVLQISPYVVQNCDARSRDIKSWSQEHRWRVLTKSENLKLYRTIATFRRSLIATQRQFAKQSRSLCTDVGMRHSNFYFK